MAHPFDEDPILVEVSRNGFVESVHRGRVVVTDPDGRVSCSVGAASALMYPRSASKPLQTVGMLRCGLDVPDELLALVSGSHSGEQFHQNGVRRLLASVGLDEEVLQTPPSWPLDEVEKEAVLRAGGQRSRVAMGCSGKHAGMLWTVQHNGWDLATYLDSRHPLQMALRDTFADLAAEYVADTAVDGCGTPLFSLSLVGLARSFGAIVSAAGHGRRLADAIRSHPEWASGTRRDEYALHRAVPGLLAKSGAEAVQAVGLPDGRGVAVKISDGSARARAVAMAGVLQRLGFDHETLDTQAALPVFGGGRPVGAVRPYLPTMRLIGA